MSKELVDQVLGEFGRQIGLDGLGLDDNGHAALAFDEVVVNLELDEEGERLLLAAHLGKPQGDPLKAYELLLDANFCWQGTAEGTLGLQRATGAIVLFRPLPTVGLDRVALETTLESFINTAEAWTFQLARPEPAPTEEPGHRLPNREQPIIRG